MENLDEVLREKPLRARWRTRARRGLVTRRLVNMGSGEELDCYSFEDTERAWEASASFELVIEEYWLAREYSIWRKD